MRCHWLLLAGLLILSGGGLASAQQEEVAEPVPAATTSTPAVSQPPASAKLVELEFWVVNLGAATTPEQWDAAQADVASRDEVAQRFRQLQQDKLVARSRYYKAVVLEGHEFTSQQGIREPRIQSVNKTQFGDQMSLVYEPVGSLLTATTTLDPETRVVCKLGLEETYLEDSKTPIQRDKEGNTTTAPRFQTFTFQGTVACPEGAARVVMASAPEGDSHQPAVIIFMAAKRVD